jgi:hypothetical protein
MALPYRPARHANISVTFSQFQPVFDRRTVMNSDLTTDNMVHANRRVTHPADAPHIETEVSGSAETNARAIQERRCELFEGGLGI